MTFAQIIIRIAERGICFCHDGKLRIRATVTPNAEQMAWIKDHAQELDKFFVWGNRNGGVCVASAAIAMTRNADRRKVLADLFRSITDEIAAAHAVLDLCEEWEALDAMGRAA